MPDHDRSLLRFSAIIAPLALGAVGVVLGLPIWLLVLGAVLPWALVVSRRAGMVAALVVAVVGTPLVVLLTAMSAPVLGTPFLTTNFVVLITVGIAGAVVVAPHRVRLPGRSALPVLMGSVVWLAILAACQLVPGATRLSWVIMGDAPTNVLLARSTLDTDGVLVGATENPAVLPHVLLALGMSSGRGGVSAAHLLAHDLSAFLLVWVLVIAVMSIMLGVLAVVVVGSVGWRGAVVASAASLLPFSWLLGAYPVQFGFLNAAIVLPVLFASVVAFLRAPRHPVLSSVVLLGACVVVLATWGPAVVIPAVLLALTIVTSRGALLRAPRSHRIALAGVAIAALAYAGLVSVPSLTAHTSFLSSAGESAPIPTTMQAAVLVVGGAIAVLAFRIGHRSIAIALAGTIAGALLALGAVVLVLGVDPQQYYAQKLAWLGLCVVVVLGGLVAMRLLLSLAPVSHTRLRDIAALCVGLLVAVGVSPPAEFGASTLAIRMLTAGFPYFTEASATEVIANSDPDNPVLLWRTDVRHEKAINAWLFQLHDDVKPTSLAMRTFAHDAPDIFSVQYVCDAAGFFDQQLTVETRSSSLPAGLATTCPDENIAVVER